MLHSFHNNDFLNPGVRSLAEDGRPKT